MSESERTGPTRTERLLLGLAIAVAACGGEAKKKPDDAAPVAAPAPAPARTSVTEAAVPVDVAGSSEPESDMPDGECPQPSSADTALDEAGRAYEAGEFATAFACANLAVDLVPQAVEAQHLRAAALAALGKHEMAQVGFAMALALDPDDPETLAAAADFYINILPPKRRDHVLVGLEYARRGSERAATRRRLDRTLRARLFLLEAEAYNDIGRADISLPRVDEALALTPSLVEAQHERGVSLFNLCRFRDAEAAFLAVLKVSPDDPYAHYHLGLIYERMGRDGDAESHLARARQLASDELGAPVAITREEFDAEVKLAISEQSAEVRKLLTGISLELVDVPALEDLTAVDPPFAPTIMGLFRGLPLGVEEDDDPSGLGEDSQRRAHDAVMGKPGASEVPPRAIVLYRRNLARAARSRDELNRQIRRTLLHEIGHLRGMDEDELRRHGLE